MAKLMGIDVGTSGCKVMVIDENGVVTSQASAEYPLSVPQQGWSEQNPEDWWLGVSRCLSEIGERRPDAIGLTGQMHGSVFLDSAGEVVRPALLWNDQRTAEECREIENALGLDRLVATTCNPMLTGFQLPKIVWLRNHELSHYQRVRKVLLPKDYIRYRLTGEMLTDVSDASGTGILDVPERRWALDLIADLELDPSLFPHALESAQEAGRTTGSGGLDQGVPVMAGAGDQAAAAVGTGAVEPGVISVSLGTSGVVFTSVEAPRADPTGAAHVFCHANGSWHAMGVMLSCGGALRWYRDTFGFQSYDEIVGEAQSVEPGSAGVTFLPYLTGERCPQNDPEARACWSGIALGHRRPHLSRAVMEGVSFGLLECYELLVSLGAQASEVRVTSGGSKSAFWVQLLADLFQTPCHRLHADEGPAFGAALMAGVGIGIWPDVPSASRAAVRLRDRFSPSGMDYRASYTSYRKLYRTLRG